MAKPRPHAYLVVPLLVLTLFLVGCPKRPAGTGALAPAPSATPAPPAGPAGPAASAGQPGRPGQAGQAAPGSMVRPGDFSPTPNLKTIYFDFDKYNIRPDAAKTLNGDAAWLKANPNNLVLIEGHCDERGTNEYNLVLGEKRAKAAMNYLVGQGVQANRITTISYGKERPVCTEKTEACWAKNRRDSILTKAR